MNSVTGPTQTNPSETNTTSTNSNATVPKLADAELVKTIEAQGTNEPINWGLFVEKLAGTVAAICLAISLYVAWRGWGQPFDPHKMPWPHIRILQACIVVTWIIIPPMWFWLDYFFIYLRNHKMEMSLHRILIFLSTATIFHRKYGSLSQPRFWRSILDIPSGNDLLT